MCPALVSARRTPRQNLASVPNPSLNPSLTAAQVLHASLAKAGTAKVLPYLVMFATSNLGGWAGDHLIATRRASVAGARKAVNSLGARPCAPDGPSPELHAAGRRRRRCAVMMRPRDLTAVARSACLVAAGMEVGGWARAARLKGPARVLMRARWPRVQRRAGWRWGAGRADQPRARPRTSLALGAAVLARGAFSTLRPWQGSRLCRAAVQGSGARRARCC